MLCCCITNKAYLKEHLTDVLSDYINIIAIMKTICLMKLAQIKVSYTFGLACLWLITSNYCNSFSWSLLFWEDTEQWMLAADVMWLFSWMATFFLSVSSTRPIATMQCCDGYLSSQLYTKLPFQPSLTWHNNNYIHM